MKIWEKFKFGIFDVDGTLFDNVKVMTNAFLSVIDKFGLPKINTYKIYVETNGMNLNDQFKLVFKMHKIKYDAAIIGDLNKKYFSLRDNWHKWQNAPLFPGTKSVLKTLHKNEIKLFVSSGSNTSDVFIRLKKSKISKYFDLILGAETIPKGPLHIARFAAFSGVSEKEFVKNAFMVSDGPNDMALAKKAGIFAIGVTHTVNANKLKSAGANIIINDTKKITAELTFV